MPQNDEKDAIVSRELGVNLTPIEFMKQNQKSEEIPDASANKIKEPIKDSTDDVSEKTVNKSAELDKSQTDSEVDTTISKEEIPEKKVENKSEVKFTENPNTVFAQYYKTLGRLPEDFEVSEDMTPEQLDKAVWSHQEEKMMALAKSEYYKEQEAQGVTAETIERAKSLSAGATEQDISDLDFYSGLSNISFEEQDKDSESYELNFKDYMTLYYSLKELPEDRIQKMVEEDFNDKDSHNQSIELARKEFSSEKKAIEIDIQNQRKAREKEREDNVKKQEKQFRDIVAKEAIDGFAYTQEQKDLFIEAYFTKSETLEMEDGRVYKVTPYYKKAYEHGRDPEKVIRQRMDFFLGLDRKEIDDKSVNTATRKFMDQLGQIITKEAPAKLKSDQTVSKQGIVSRELGNR